MTGQPCGPSGIHDKSIGLGDESDTLSLPGDLERRPRPIADPSAPRAATPPGRRVLTAPSAYTFPAASGYWYSP